MALIRVGYGGVGEWCGWRWLEPGLVYAIGTVAMFWLFERVAGLVMLA